jgi:hypothetical protein
MPSKKRDEPILRDFTPYDPFEAGRIMVRVKRTRIALWSILLPTLTVIIVTAIFLVIIYFWPDFQPTNSHDDAAILRK